MYNIGKVGRGGILTWFNETFDALCKLSADPENSVKAGAELLDRLLKDIIAEGSLPGVSSVALPPQTSTTPPYLPRLPNFSLERFIPLLKERLYAVNPNTRTFLVDWLLLLDSIPDLELVRYLPDFLDGLFGYLSDPNQEVRTRTGNLLGELLAEVREVERVQRERNEVGARDDGRYVFGENVKLDYGRMMGIVAPFLVSNGWSFTSSKLLFSHANLRVPLQTKRLKQQHYRGRNNSSCSQEAKSFPLCPHLWAPFYLALPILLYGSDKLPPRPTPLFSNSF